MELGSVTQLGWRWTQEPRGTEPLPYYRQSPQVLSQALRKCQYLCGHLSATMCAIVQKYPPIIRFMIRAATEK